MLKPGDMYVEAGAYIGRHGLIASMLGAKAVLIEPSPDNIAAIEKLIKEKNLTNVTLVKKALWSKKGIQKFCATGNPCAHKIGGGGQDYVDVETDTLDGILNDLGIETVNLLAMDIEGAEAEVVKTLDSKRVLNLAIGSYHLSDPVTGGEDVKRVKKEIIDVLDSKDYTNITYEGGVVYACAGTNLPKVLVAFLVRNGEKWLNRFLRCLDSLDYPKGKLKIAIVEGNSEDASWNLLNNFAVGHQNVWLNKYEINTDLQRYRRLAVLRNKLIDQILTDEKYVLWLDSDLTEFSSSLLKDLINRNGDVVAPYALIEGTDNFYDTLAFRKDGLKFSFLPSDKGVIYCTQNEKGALIGPLPSDVFEVDSVGTCMLVNADVYRKGVRFPESDVESEQVLFCDAARKNGFRVLADPRVKVFHADLPKYGVAFH
jgi:FkbM family methyltransferase